MAVPAYKNFTKIHQSFQKLLVGDTQTDRQTDTHTHTDRQAGDLINPLSFFESRLKKDMVKTDTNLLIDFRETQNERLYLETTVSCSL
jgi:hypothetical protein